MPQFSGRESPNEKPAKAGKRGRRVSGEHWTHEDRVEVGKRLALVEEIAGVSGSEMARLLGISQQAWSDCRRGERNLQLESARKLKARFGCSFDWLYIGDESNNTVAFQGKLNAIRRANGKSHPELRPKGKS
jgi:transcriptional regulator with XRE-family HTH domain